MVIDLRDRQFRRDDAQRFVRVPERAYTLPPLELAVLVGLLRFCHRTPFCWPSQETLAAVIAKPRSTVSRGLRGSADIASR